MRLATDLGPAVEREVTCAFSPGANLSIKALSSPSPCDATDPGGCSASATSTHNKVFGPVCRERGRSRQVPPRSEDEQLNWPSGRQKWQRSAEPGCRRALFFERCRRSLELAGTLLKVDVRLVPTAWKAPIAATEIRAAMSPYSIAVAPSSFFRRLIKIAYIFRSSVGR